MDYGKINFERKLQELGFDHVFDNTWSFEQNGYKFVYDFDIDRFTIVQNKQRVYTDEVCIDLIFNTVQCFTNA